MPRSNVGSSQTLRAFVRDPSPAAACRLAIEDHKQFAQSCVDWDFVSSLREAEACASACAGMRDPQREVDALKARAMEARMAADEAITLGNERDALRRALEALLRESPNQSAAGDEARRVLASIRRPEL